MANKNKLSSDWEEVGKSPAWDFQEEGAGATFFGVYIGKQSDVGPNNSMLYEFIRYEDEQLKKRVGPMSIWGTSLLDVRFKNFVKGEQVAILYLGKVESEKRKGAMYHNFEVYHRPPEKKVDIEGNELWDEAVDEFNDPEYIGPLDN